MGNPKDGRTERAKLLLEGVQLVEQGPDVPLYLLRAQECGDLVFFCGAGLSVQAGLPSFSGLVRGLREDLRAHGDAHLEDLIQEERWEEAIRHLFGSFERADIIRSVRKRLVAGENADASSHEAILNLALDEFGGRRIVTTNYDDIFDRSSAGPLPAHRKTAAPLLPVPKKEKWSELVYLHGRFRSDYKEGEKEETIVLSPADFGLAYLHEQWAARFVSELLRNFVVVFVGYGVDDIIIRYLIDAIAAERIADPGRAKPVFAFAAFDSSTKERSRDAIWERWMERGVLPILYDTAEQSHLPLHASLREWSRIVRQGLASKANIIRELASKSPNALPRFERTRLIWAISDSPQATTTALRDSVAASETLALHPEWLSPSVDGAASNPIADLVCGRSSHGVAIDPSENCRPALIGGGLGASGPLPLSRNQRAVADLLIGSVRREETSEEVARRIGRLGGRLHPEFASIVRRDLDLQRIVGHSVRKFWRGLTGLLPLGNIEHDFEAYELIDRIKASAGVEAESKEDASDAEYEGIQFDIIRLLQPRLVVEHGEPIHFAARKAGFDISHSVKQIAAFRIQIGHSDCNHEIVAVLSRLRRKSSVFHRAAREATRSLRIGLEALKFLDHVDQRQDFSSIHRPSIESGQSHTDSGMWTVAVDILVKFLEFTRPESKSAAREMVNEWAELEFPIFRRLTLFAARRFGLKTPLQLLCVIKAAPGHWLWSPVVQRELLEVLPVMWNGLDSRRRKALANLIKVGPSPDLFRIDLDGEERERLMDRFRWMRARRIVDAVPDPGDDIQSILREIESRQPTLRQATVDTAPVAEVRTFWHAEPTDFSMSDLASMAPDKLCHLLLTHEHHRPGLLESWKSVASSDNALALVVALQLPTEGAEPAALAQVWEATLCGLSEPTDAGSASALLPVLVDIDAQIASSCLRCLADFLLGSAKLKIRTDAWFRVWDKARVALSPEPIALGGADAFTNAINSACGVLTQSLIDGLETTAVARENRLPEVVASRLEWCISNENPESVLSCAIVGSRAYLLHWLDEEWSQERVLPLFDLSVHHRAIAAWQGFFYNARVSPSMWRHLKTHFINVVKSCDELGQVGNESLPHFLASVSIDGVDALTVHETTRLLSDVGPDRRGSIAWMLWRRLEDAGEKAAALWQGVIGNWIERCWPRHADAKSPKQSNFLAMSALSVGSAFPLAAEVVSQFLCPVEHIHVVASKIGERIGSPGFGAEEAEASLKILSAVARSPLGFQGRDVCKLVKQIEVAHPPLSVDPRLIRLKKSCEQEGL